MRPSESAVRFPSSRLAAAFSSLPAGQGRFASYAAARFPLVGTADRPLLRAHPRLTSPGAQERPLPERNKHFFPSAGAEARPFPSCKSNPPVRSLLTAPALLKN